MRPESHWQAIYTQKDPKQVSWFQEHAETSLRIIQVHEPNKAAHIIDVGAGASTLVDDLLAAGYVHLDVLDISQEALQVAQKRLQENADKVTWRVDNILTAALPAHQYDVWHDRAVFHFLTDEAERKAYVKQVLHALKPGGKVIISTFGPDGPLMCSGLPIVRYDHQRLHSEFGQTFELLGHTEEDHLTPEGSVQKFIYCYCRLQSA